MAKSIGSFVLQFGMVSIPTDLHTVATAARSKTGLNQLHGAGECMTRLNQVMVCKAHNDGGGVIVPKEDIVKGFEYAKGLYVLVTEDDLATIPLPSKGTVEITSFCPAGEIDPSRFEGAYHLEPGKGGARPFALLARAMEADNLAAIATISVRSKEQLCAIRFAGGYLFLHPLFYEQELNIAWGKSLPAEVNDKELAMARQLTAQLLQPFDGEQYEDRYTAAFETMIERKLDPTAPKVPVPAPAPRKEVDFMAALEASLAKKAAPAAGARPKKKGAAA